MDRSKLVEKEKIIKKQEEEIYHLKNIIDNLPGDIFWKNRHGAWMGINNQGLKSLRNMGYKYTKEDIIGKKDKELFPEKTAEEFQKNDEYVIRENKSVSVEEPHRLSNGEKIYQISSKRPLYDKNNNVAGIIGNTLNITQLKKTQENLKKAKEKSEASKKLLSKFITNISHDLRTPIAGIIGMTEDLLNLSQTETQKDKKPTKENLENEIKKTKEIIYRDATLIIESSKKLLELCNEAIETTAEEKTKEDEKKNPVYLKKILQDIIKLSSPAAIHNKNKISLNIENDLLKPILVKEKCLKTTLVNLISNAIKFTENGLIKIKASLVEKNKTLKVEVQDNGIGIAKDKLDYIFEKFSKLSPSYEGNYKGRGLGLCFAKSLVKELDGKISVVSEPEIGSCFTIKIPIKTSQEKIKENKIKEKNQEEKETKTGLTLIVEDDKIARVALNLLIKSIGCQTRVAKTGKEAIHAISKNNFDLILLDIGLPDISGFKVAKKAQELARKNKKIVPIVAITGHANSEENKKLAKDCGIREVISKPAQKDTLKLILNKYIKQSNKKNNPKGQNRQKEKITI